MTEESQNPTSEQPALSEAIVHALDNGSMRIELPGHLNVWVGHDQHLLSPALLALQAGERPEGVICDHFPGWQDLQWVDAGWFPPAPADIVSAPAGQYIALGPPHGKLMNSGALVEAFQAWLRDWEDEERELADAEELETEGAREQGNSKSFMWHGLTFVAVSALLIFLTYVTLKALIPADIAKREPIGAFVAAHASGEWAYPTTLETEFGVYPVGKVLMVDKGAPLSLIILSNGMRAICDERLKVCARTVGEERRIAITRGGQ